MDIKRTLIAALFMSVLLAGIKISLQKKSHQAELDSYAEAYEIKKKSKKIKLQDSYRKPASVPAPYFPERNAAGFRQNTRNEELFQDNADGELAPVISSGPIDNGQQPLVTEDYSYRPDYRNRLPSGNSSHTPTAPEALPVNQGGQSFSSVGLDNSTGVVSNPDIPVEDSRGSNNDPVKTPENYTCSASVGEGTFSSPINLSLSCSSPGEIKYCIGEGECCDPDTGALYVSTIMVGASASTYCVSFKGVSNKGAVSTISERTYTFNPALADLQISHKKKFYQTTELMGLMSITSDDFQKNGYSVGVINMKSHDPGTDGLNLTCQQIIEDDHSSLTPDVPAFLLPDTDISGMASSSQLDVDLDTSNLIYGENYLTSYMKNVVYSSSVYSCVTSKITLRDFEYFQYTPTNYIAGSLAIGEFAGGFTHLGFFEPVTEIIHRGPAGVGTHEVDTQELRFGLFSVFY